MRTTDIVVDVVAVRFLGREGGQAALSVDVKERGIIMARKQLAASSESTQESALRNGGQRRQSQAARAPHPLPTHSLHTLSACWGLGCINLCALSKAAVSEITVEKNSHVII
eukprot:3933196-Rhodomonas_salina.2